MRFHRILVPTDGSETALRAARLAARLAAEWDAEVVLLTAVAVPQQLVMLVGIGRHVVEEYVERAGNDALEPALEAFREAGIGVEVKIEVGTPVEVIVSEIAQTAVDLVIMGKQGLGQLQSLLLGSVTERVLRHVQIPVLLVP